MMKRLDRMEEMERKIDALDHEIDAWDGVSRWAGEKADRLAESRDALAIRYAAAMQQFNEMCAKEDKEDKD